MIEELEFIHAHIRALRSDLKTLTEKVERLEKKELPTGEEYIPWKNGRIIRYKKDHTDIRIFFAVPDIGLSPRRYWLNIYNMSSMAFEEKDYSTKFWEIVNEYTIVGIDKV